MSDMNKNIMPPKRDECRFFSFQNVCFLNSASPTITNLTTNSEAQKIENNQIGKNKLWNGGS